MTKSSEPHHIRASQLVDFHQNLCDEMLIEKISIKQEGGEFAVPEVYIKEEPPDGLEMGREVCTICGNISMEQPFKEAQQCIFCGKLNADVHKFKQHHKTVHKIKEEVLKIKTDTFSNECKVPEQKQQRLLCNKEVKDTKRHHKFHNESAKICEICGVTLKNRISVERHVKRSHGTENYPCEICGRSFKAAPELRSHHTRLHAEPTHTCKTCGKKFSTGSRLKIHINTTHLKLRPHICEFCKKGFSSKFAMTTHRRQHTNETPYKCEECGQGFRVKVSLKTHMKSKHNIEELKPCVCQFCGKGMASDWALKTHLRVHD